MVFQQQERLLHFLQNCVPSIIPYCCLLPLRNITFAVCVATGPHVQLAVTCTGAAAGTTQQPDIVTAALVDWAGAEQKRMQMALSGVRLLMHECCLELLSAPSVFMPASQQPASYSYVC